MSTDDAARLLIADDDPNLLAAYVLFFSAHGFDIRTARNGLDALAHYCGTPGPHCSTSKCRVSTDVRSRGASGAWPTRRRPCWSP